MAELLTSSLVTNYNQQETDVLYDLTSKIMLRGGYRYVWGEANDAILPARGADELDQAKLRRNVGLGAVTFRLAPKLSLTGEAEVGSSGGAYFRTSLTIIRKFVHRRAIRPSSRSTLPPISRSCKTTTPRPA